MAAETSKKIYQIIPRKYRPQTFASIVGQEAIVTTLKNSLRLGRLAHAYLFCGSRGTGKTTLARLFAKALNCRKLTEDLEPCNECPSCLEVSTGRSLDVLEIDGASNRGIDDIRQINETIGYAPASGKYKIYIIDEVHMLTKEAFNALLKTLEEPPPAVKFFFATTEPHKVLATIVSRCQRFDLSRISLEAMHFKLKRIVQDLNVEIEDEALRLIAKMSEGSLRDAESLLDQVISFAEHPISASHVSSILGLMPRSAFFQLDQAIASGNFSFAFELAEQIFASGKDLACFLEDLMEHYRNVLVLKVNKNSSFISNETDRQKYAESTALYTEEQCLYIIDVLIHWLQQISKTPFKRLSLEMILLHLIRSQNRIPVEALVQRLCALEKSFSPLCESTVEEPSPVVEEVKNTPEPQTPAAPLNDASLEQKLLKAIKSKMQDAPAPSPQNAPIQAVSENPQDASQVQSQLFSFPPKSEIKQNPEKIINQEEKKLDPRQEPTKRQGKYETLIRFAAVELEGSVKKE
jgi:DNA polymerase III subunit gamma/tau